MFVVVVLVIVLINFEFYRRREVKFRCNKIDFFLFVVVVFVVLLCFFVFVLFFGCLKILKVWYGIWLICYWFVGCGKDDVLCWYEVFL